MELTLVREKTKNETTMGILYKDGLSYCFTLEDAIREVTGQDVKKWKIYGKTAIPQGKYLITIENSEKFNREVPYLHDVPGFSGILIHGGNTIDDTFGCICIGANRNIGIGIKNSHPLVTNLTAMLKSAEQAENKTKNYITIVNP